MFGDKFNLGSLIKNAKKMQEMVQQAQEEMEKIEITGESGGGSVKITMTARHFAKKVVISDEIMSEDKQIIEDLVAAAINDATAKVEAIAKNKMMDASSLLGGMASGDDKE